MKAKDVIFYQNKASCHAAGAVQSYLAASFPCFIPNALMSPNSSDFIVLDYCTWALSKERLLRYEMISNFEKLEWILNKVEADSARGYPGHRGFLAVPSPCSGGGWR